jgi:hypothetical protein
MRHLHLVVDHEPAPTDFPPTWNEFEAARRRFFNRLAAAAVPAPDDASPKAEPPKEGVAP